MNVLSPAGKLIMLQNLKIWACLCHL